MNHDQRSLIVPLGYQASDCGYCKGKDSGASYYVSSKRLTVEAYQALVDRGWRRSGTLVYKPDVLRACCPHYTIRLAAAGFRPSRDQRQALNRWNRYILGDKYVGEVARRFPKTKEEKKRAAASFNLVETIHEPEVSELKPVEPAHRLEVTLEHDDFTDEKFSLFEDYQSSVHKEKPGDITRSGFRRFLCDSPLQRNDRKGKRLGSYHQCYRIDGRLIAMAVLDLLPHAVSGVYFIYHRDFEKWSLGKISALREAALALEGGYEYYYMGYYIHNCAKMRYKGDYKPQQVLDPMTYDWYMLEDLRPTLDKRKFVTLLTSKEGPAQSDAENVESLMAEQGQFIGPDGEVWLHSSPSEAGASGDSLFAMRMPGLKLLEEVEKEGLLDELYIKLAPNMVVQASDLVAWHEETASDGGLKTVLTELSACVGPYVTAEMVVDLSR